MTDLQGLKTALSVVPIVPVLTIDRIEDAVPLATALAQGGLRVAEVTLRTPAALKALGLMRQAVPDLMIGAGTITELDHISAATDAGAQFLVSPGVTPALADALVDAPVPAIPGVATASEAMALARLGFDILKLFPAVPIGGVNLLKALAAPLPDISFMPTGGITATSAPDFLTLSNVVAIGGSWMVRKSDIADENWADVEATVRSAVELGRRA